MKSYKLFLNKNCLAESSTFLLCYTFFSNYNAENFCLKWLLALFFSNPANLIYETILVFTWQNSKYTIRTRRHKNTVVVAEYYFQYNKNEYDKLTLTRNSVTTNLNLLHYGPVRLRHICYLENMRYPLYSNTGF